MRTIVSGRTAANRQPCRVVRRWFVDPVGKTLFIGRGTRRAAGLLGGALGLLSLAGAAGAVGAASAAPAADGAAHRLAIVVGETQYASLPPLDACAASAGAVRARLQQLGFTVIGRDNASNGEMSAILESAARKLAAAPGASFVSYTCGYAVGYERRVFLLPTGAVLQRPSDVLTQGLPAKTLLDLAARGSRPGLTVLDTFAPPHGTAADLPGFAAALRPAAGQVFVAVAEPAAGTIATPVAQHFAEALERAPVPVAPLIDALRQGAATAASAFAVAGDPGDLSLIPPPPPPPPAPHVVARVAGPVVPAAAVPVAAVPPPAAAPASAAAPAAPAVAAAPQLPEEEAYTDLDRRRVQAALKLLGYYAGDVDGLIGPDTRAAIRRYQHELGAPMTGELTPAEADRLVAGLGAG